MPSGRKARNVEFIQTLKELTEHKKTIAFAKACGQQTSNMSRYLSGNLVPGKKVLASCAEALFAMPIRAMMEVMPVPQKLNSLPTSSGIYVLYDSGANVLYVGRASNFRSEVTQALRKEIPVPLRLGPTLGKASPKLGSIASRLSLYSVPSPKMRHKLESLLLRIFVNQTHNSNIGKL